jgi:MFS family permease
VFGLRSFLLIAATLFVSFSVVCGLSDTLPMMIVGRIGQGFTGGALIPTAMTIIATRLPREQQPIGNAAFGATAIMGPVMGPVVGGWLNENVSWHYAFFINVPVGLAMIAMIGMMMYGTSYVIPQFLSTIAGYNALQSGEVVLLSGVPMILMMPFTPWLVRTLNIRLAAAFGMTLLAYSSWLETDLSADSAGTAFAGSQILRGIGTVFSSMFMNQAAIRSVPPSQASDASGLYNTARNLGGSLALAGIGVVQEHRLWLHSRRLEESLSANSDGVQSYIQAQGGGETALRGIESTIQTQAITMTYADLFWILTIGILCVTPLVLFLRPLPKNAPLAVAH